MPFRLLHIPVIFSLLFLFACAPAARFNSAKKSTEETENSKKESQKRFTEKNTDFEENKDIDSKTNQNSSQNNKILVSPDGKDRIISSSITINEERYKNVEPVETFFGLASFYADKYHGRVTTNGEIYDMDGLTAAHPDWPFDTILRVINLENNLSAIIRINDRMPLHPERMIDLSLGTAKKIDSVIKGVVSVRIEILEWGKK